MPKMKLLILFSKFFSFKEYIVNSLDSFALEKSIENSCEISLG